MKIRPLLLTALAAGHLVLVACGAAYVSLSGLPKPLGPGLRCYNALSGAGAGYGFFAPGVAAQLRVAFTMKDDSGRTWNDTLDLGSSASHEAQLRLGSMIFVASIPEMTDGILASWAATMFGRHPSARQVVIQVDRYELPTMAQYREGQQPQWKVACQATFSRDSTRSPMEAKQ